MSNKETIEQYFQDVIETMAETNPKVPVSKFRVTVTDSGGQMFGPDWFQYMIYGRGPGKQPPPDRMLSWVESNPDIFASAQTKFQNITPKGLAFIVGRKIGREGTDIFQGKRKGVDLLDAMEKNMPELLQALLKNQLVQFQTSFHKAIKI